MKEKIRKLLCRAWKYFIENWIFVIANICIAACFFGIVYMLYCAATSKIEGPCVITVTDLKGNVLHKYYGNVRWIKHNDRPTIEIEYNHDFK